MESKPWFVEATFNCYLQLKMYQCSIAIWYCCDSQALDFVFYKILTLTVDQNSKAGLQTIGAGVLPSAWGGCEGDGWSLGHEVR